ncbi:MAG: hypothetical protein MAG451_01612 [Anaerolineales bacterium]|nr:hypothetical protein [Anaerolineales bacterium]
MPEPDSLRRQRGILRTFRQAAGRLTRTVDDPSHVAVTV